MNNERLERMRAMLTPMSVECAREIARERAQARTPADTERTPDASISVTVEINGVRQDRRIANT